MGEMTLSKLQKKQYKEIVRLFSDKNIISLENADYVRLKETLGILEFFGCIRKLNINGTNAFEKIGSFSDFDKWHKDKEREERKLSLREWKIAIVSALIGGLVTTVAQWISSLF